MLYLPTTCMTEGKAFEWVEKIIVKVLEPELNKLQQLKQQIIQEFRKEFGCEPTFIKIKNAMKTPEFKAAYSFFPTGCALLYEIEQLTPSGQFKEETVIAEITNCKECEEHDWQVDYVGYDTIILSKVKQNVKFTIQIK